MLFIRKFLYFHATIVFICVCSAFVLQVKAFANEPDYGLYSSLIMDYKTAYGELDFYTMEQDPSLLYYTKGVVYTRLIDFNQDGLLELVLVLFGEDSDYLEPTVFIYGFIDNQLSQLAQFLPISYGNDSGKLILEYAVVDNEIYFVSGFDGMDMKKEFWRLTFGGFVLGFDMHTRSNHDNQNIEYYVNGNLAGSEEFGKELERWTANTQVDAISCLSQEQVDLLIQKNMEAVSLLPLPSNATTNVGSFNDSQFVIYHGHIKDDYQELVKNYFNALVNNDLDALSLILGSRDESTSKEDMFRSDAELNVSRAQIRFETKQYVPGYIIHKFRTIPDAEIGYDYVELSEEILPYTPEKLKGNLTLVEVTVNEVKDFSHSTFAPQIGYGRHKYWFVLGKEYGNEPLKIYALYTDKFFEYGVTENAFKLKFLGYDSEIGNNVLSEVMEYIDIENMQNLLRFLYEGDEYYLMKPVWDDSILQVYELLTLEDGSKKKGKLLIESEAGDSLLIKCNLSDIHPNVIVETKSPNGITYAQIPRLNTRVKDKADYAPYAEIYPFK